MKTRPGKAGDAPACAAIFNDWVDATDWMPRVHSHADVARHYRDRVLPRQDVHVGEENGVICGFIAADGPFVTALYLAPAARNRGLGARLLASTRQSPQRLWTFQPNTAACRFYAREGFRENRRTEGDNEEGLPDILLERAT